MGANTEINANDNAEKATPSQQDTPNAALRADDVAHYVEGKEGPSKSPKRATASADADNEIMQAINDYREENPHTRMSR